MGSSWKRRKYSFFSHPSPKIDVHIGERKDFVSLLSEFDQKKCLPKTCSFFADKRMERQLRGVTQKKKIASIFGDKEKNKMSEAKAIMELPLTGRRREIMGKGKKEVTTKRKWTK